MALRIVQLTDLHLLQTGEKLMGLDVEARLEAVLTDAARQNPDLYCITGDFCAHDPELRVYEWLRPRLDKLGKPYLLIAGNHDDRAMMRRAFSLPGESDAPLHGSVAYGGQTLLFLDTSKGRIADDQLDWLATALRDHPHAPIFMHHPPLEMGVRFMDRKYPLQDTGRLLQLLRSDGRHRRIFCGHYHTSRTVTREGLEVFLCPPTSFFIRPGEENFELEPHYPGYLILEWTDAGTFSCTEKQVYHNQDPER